MQRIDNKKKYIWLRGLIQIVYFLFLPSAFTAAFSAVKYIFTRLGAGEKIELTAFVSVCIVLCGYTMIFGRFFCGFACAFGSLGDAVHAAYLQICKKLKKKAKRLPQAWAKYLSSIKYMILAAIAVLCFAGVYGRTKGLSPWDVFSMMHAGNFKLAGYMQGIVLLILILVGMALEERFFCRFLCPMGAVFSLLPTLPFFTLKRNREQCLHGCKGCTAKCPCGIAIPEEGSLDVKGDCFMCQKCMDVCPKENIHYKIRQLKGHESLFTIFRAVLLFALLLWAGA